MKIGRFSRLLFITLFSFLLSGQVLADKIKVAGIYTQPLQQKWDARLHLALQAAADRGEIDYVNSEKVSNTDYVRVLREYSESGVDLIVGEAFGISAEARKVADDYPNIAYLMGDPGSGYGGEHGGNFSVFDNYIHVMMESYGKFLSQFNNLSK